MFKAIKVKISGYGRYRPKYMQNSEELDVFFGQEKGFTFEKFGIVERPIANREETTSFMAAQASIEALEQAKIKIPDAIFGACGVMEQPIPSTAVFVQKALGLEKSGIQCLDINMTCLSFMAAFETAAMMIAMGRIKTALIFSSDIASAGLNYKNPEVSAIFGDGAAAIVIEGHDDENGPALLATNFKTYSSGIDTAHLRAGGTKIRIDDGYDALKEGAKFHMDPVGIFRAAGRYIPRILNDILEDAKIKIDDIDNFICHQASAPALEYLRHIVKNNDDRIIDIFPHYGNQIAASLPNALYEAAKTGRLKPNSHALFLGTSAGVSIGAMVLRL